MHVQSYVARSIEHPDRCHIAPRLAEGSPLAHKGPVGVKDFYAVIPRVRHVHDTLI